MSARYRWYSIGFRRTDQQIRLGQPATEKPEILGWSRNRITALGRTGTVAVYYASSRRMAARMAKHDRGFDIEWKKFDLGSRDQS
jgi:hypothetical protein